MSGETIEEEVVHVHEGWLDVVEADGVRAHGADTLGTQDAH